MIDDELLMTEAEFVETAEANSTGSHKETPRESELAGGAAHDPSVAGR